jgi:hypothetical protein
LASDVVEQAVEIECRARPEIIAVRREEGFSRARSMIKKSHSALSLEE